MAGSAFWWLTGAACWPCMCKVQHLSCNTRWLPGLCPATLVNSTKLQSQLDAWQRARLCLGKCRHPVAMSSIHGLLQQCSDALRAAPLRAVPSHLQHKSSALPLATASASTRAHIRSCKPGFHCPTNLQCKTLSKTAKLFVREQVACINALPCHFLPAAALCCALCRCRTLRDGS